MTITKETYDQAVRQKEDSQEIINAYHKEQGEAFDKRLKSGVPFTDEELIYSATSLCPCGHGIAYPKHCGPWHYWDCSAILKGIADPSAEHTGRLPFNFYDVKSEDQPSANGSTTRGVFRPKIK